MINLTGEEITHIHKKLIEKTGGMPELRTLGMLESAVYVPCNLLVKKRFIQPLMNVLQG